MQLAAQRLCCSCCSCLALRKPNLSVKFNCATCPASRSRTQATLPHTSRTLTPSPLPPQFRSDTCCTFTLLCLCYCYLCSFFQFIFKASHWCTLDSALLTCHVGKFPYPHILRTCFSAFHVDTMPSHHIPCTNIAAYCERKWNLLCTGCTPFLFCYVYKFCSGGCPSVHRRMRTPPASAPAWY